MADATNPKITLFTTEPCGFCRQAKALLAARGLEYDEINLAKDPSGRADLVARTGQMTFPQILVGERAIGGFRELLEADRAGVLETLIAAALRAASTGSPRTRRCRAPPRGASRPAPRRAGT